MDKTQLIKQEIERLKHNTPNAYDLSRFMLLQEIEEFINSLPEEPVSKDLEEEIERCWNEIFPIGWSDTTLLTLTHEEHAAFARHFAEWQKQQMMKDVVEGEIGDIMPLIEVDEMNNYLNYVKAHGLKIGDKVKIIIVKEE